MFQVRTITKVLRENVRVTVHEASGRDMYDSRKMYKTLSPVDEDRDLAVLKSNFLYVAVRTSSVEGIPINLPTILDDKEALEIKFQVYMSLPDKMLDDWADACLQCGKGEQSIDPKPQGNTAKDSSNTSPQ